MGKVLAANRKHMPTQADLVPCRALGPTVGVKYVPLSRNFMPEDAVRQHVRDVRLVQQVTH